MREEIKRILDRTLEVPQYEGSSKVTTLAEAMRQYVQPGMTVCLGSLANWPNAISNELVRRFWGSKPELTLIISGFMTANAPIIHAGLVKKVAASLYSDGVYTPGPMRVVQEAFAKKNVEVENWTVLTTPLRLMAGAMDIGFIPTKSLIGSSMEVENKDYFRVIDDPFGSGQKIGLLKAINPDVCFFHGLAADPYGNTILTPPLGEDMWSAYASKKTVVTVEKIVSTEFIRKYSNLVSIPGYVVNAVCELPFGVHPQGLSNLQVPEIEGYGPDYDFSYNSRMACKTPETLETFIKDWILGCPTQEEYLQKLGAERVLFLKGRAYRDAWESEIRTLVNDDLARKDYTSTEMNVVAAARMIGERVKKEKYTVLLGGFGLGSLAIWVTYYLLKEEGYKDLDLLVETGLYGYAPRPGEPQLVTHANIGTSKMLSSKMMNLGVIVSGYRGSSLSVLGAGQVDKKGNVNSTKLSDTKFLTGSGGANDVASGAKELLVALRQSKTRFVEKVHYITAPGKRVKTVVSHLGVYEKQQDDGELVLTAVLPNPDKPSLEDRIKDAQENCGWELKVDPNVKDIAPPTLDELIITRLFDPRGVVLSDYRPYSAYKGPDQEMCSWGSANRKDIER